MRRIALLHSGALELRLDPGIAEALPGVDEWLPFSATSATGSLPDASITIREGGSTGPPSGRPALRLGGVSVWIDELHTRATLHGVSGAVAGYIDLAARSATLVVRDDSGDSSVAPDVYTMLTLSAALLLNRLGRALAHAAAVAPPTGQAWLLVGDTHAGKTTTTVNLMAAGWDYLSDDHVVLSTADSATVMVEGWPRTFHLDDGWSSGLPGGARSDTDPRTLGAAQCRISAPLSGLLFPKVVSDSETRLQTLSSGDALALLLRQSPWLVADRHAAPVILAMLASAARLPARRLILGMDTFRNPERLVRCLTPLLV